MVAADVHPGAEPWHWLCLLRSLLQGDSCSSCDAFQVKRSASLSVEKLPLPVAALRTSGDGGPDAAAWLLNEHAPNSLIHSRSEETCAGVRQTLQQAWRETLRQELGDERRAFVQQRLEQVPEALAENGLEAQVELTLEALLRSDDVEMEPGGDRPLSPRQSAAGRPAPYWFLPSDWARLSEAYQVDFVLHGLPGTATRFCELCGCAGHVHVGPREPGVDFSLHVGWRGPASGRGGTSLPEPEAEHSPKRSGSPGCAAPGAASSPAGCWEPLGSGPILGGRSSVKEKQAADGPPEKGGSEESSGTEETSGGTTKAAAGPPEKGSEASSATTETSSGGTKARGWATVVGLGCVPGCACACASAGARRQEEAKGRLMGDEKGPSCGVLQVMEGCPSPTPCPAMQAPCPPVRACQICPLAAERPGSDDFLAPEAPSSPLALPPPESKQEASGLVPVPRLERSLTRDDWPAEDLAAILESDSAMEDLPSPRCSPGQKGYVDTGAGVLAFLYDEDEPRPRTPELPPPGSQPHSPCVGLVGCVTMSSHSPSRSPGNRGASSTLAAIQELPSIGAGEEHAEALQVSE